MDMPGVGLLAGGGNNHVDHNDHADDEQHDQSNVYADVVLRVALEKVALPILATLDAEQAGQHAADNLKQVGFFSGVGSVMACFHRDTQGVRAYDSDQLWKGKGKAIARFEYLTKIVGNLSREPFHD